MLEVTRHFVNKRFVFKGKIVKVMAETDSGNVQIAHGNGSEEWTTFDRLQPIDGQTKGFRVLAIAA